MNSEDFHPLTIYDRDFLFGAQMLEQPMISDYGFSSNFIWRDAYDIRTGNICGCAVMCYHYEKHCSYSFPYGGGDVRAAIESLLKHHTDCGKWLMLSPITPEQVEYLKREFPDTFAFEEQRDFSDYVYRISDLAELPGKDYRDKRRFIRRFSEEGDWSYERLCRDNIGECLEIENAWLNAHSEDEDPGIHTESAAITRAFEHYDELGMIGGLLRKEGRIVAFMTGSRLNDNTVTAHFEKAYADVYGAYQTIFNQFVINECSDFTYLNYEDDMGRAGLRQAKQSYHPVMMARKFIAAQLK